MIYLVLYDSSPVSLDAFFHFFPFDIIPLYLDRGCSFYWTEKARKTETSLLIASYFSSFFGDHWIYHENNWIFFIVFFLWKPDYYDSLIDAYLWCSEADSSMFWIFDIGEHGLGENSIIMEFLRSYWC